MELNIICFGSSTINVASMTSTGHSVSLVDMEKHTVSFQVEFLRNAYEIIGPDPSWSDIQNYCHTYSKDFTALFRESSMNLLIAYLGGRVGSGCISAYLDLLPAQGSIFLVTKPFDFEGSRKVCRSEKICNDLIELTPNTIVVNNQDLLHYIHSKTTIKEAFSVIDEHLIAYVDYLSEVISRSKINTGSKPGVYDLTGGSLRSIITNLRSLGSPPQKKLLYCLKLLFQMIGLR